MTTAAQSYIATRCGLERPTVSTTIGELEALGLVVTIHRGGINRGLSQYRVCVPWSIQAERVSVWRV